MSSDLKFSSEFTIPNWALRTNRSHPDIVRDWVWLIQFIFIISSMFFMGFCLINCIIHYDIPEGRISEATKHGAEAIYTITIFFKYFLLFKYQKSLKKFVAMIDRDYDRSKEFSEKEQEIVRKYAKRGVNACWLYMVTGVAVFVLFSCKALLLTAHSYWKGENKLVSIIEITFPQYLDVKKEELPIFVMINMIYICYGLCSVSLFIGFDPLMPIYLLHNCGQIDILNNFVDRIKENYSLFYEYTMKTSTILLPFTIVQVIESLRHSSFDIQFLSLFIASILFFGIPCYYSDLLIEKGESFRQAIYSCGWESHPDPKTRKMLLIMLTRATKPLILNTVFYNLSLNSFAVMCKDAYAIFNLINTVMK